MARIDDSFIESVVYIYPSETDAADGEAVGGSGFLLGVPLENNTNRRLIYCVTNLHVVANMPNAVIRINTKDGKTAILKTDQSKWIMHPDGDDIALLLMKINTENHKCSYVSQEALITKDVIRKFDIGGGDDVYMVGRFSNREGREKNLPSVRKGIIASIDTEPIKNDEIGINQESFLVESHSISGYSGSPVFVMVEPFDERPDTPNNLDLEDLTTWHSWLLGVDWGHLKTNEEVRDRTGNSIQEKYHVRMNTAMMCVIPAWKIQEILNLDEQLDIRKNLDDIFTR